MPSALRIEKLNILLKEELSRIIDRQIEFPEDQMTTITRVSVSPGGHYAAVFVSILGPHPKTALENLSKNVYDVQQALNRKVRMRHVPKIHFAIDDAELRRESVEKSISNLKKKGEI